MTEVWDIDMEAIELNKKQVTEIYERCLKKDFPKAEQKPLPMILKAMDEGKYTCIGLVEAQKILGYAFFVKTENGYLFDYLAIDKEARGQNLGTCFLSLLQEKFRHVGSIIGEVEDPSCAVNDEERTIRERRYAFYMRNGFMDTGVKAVAFGVKFLILEMNLGTAHTQEEVKKLYEETYRVVLSKPVYTKHIAIL